MSDPEILIYRLIFLSSVSVSPLSHMHTYIHTTLRILHQQLQGSYSDFSNNVPFFKLFNIFTRLHAMTDHIGVLSVQHPAIMHQKEAMSYYYFLFSQLINTEHPVPYKNFILILDHANGDLQQWGQTRYLQRIYRLIHCSYTNKTPQISNKRDKKSITIYFLLFCQCVNLSLFLSFAF